MVLGLPVPSWLLLIVAVGSGLVLEVAFYRARLRDRRQGQSAPPDDGQGTGSPSRGRP